MRASFTLLQPIACIFWFAFALAAGATAPATTPAPANNLRFERLTLNGDTATKNDSLSAVRVTIQDQRGFIWFGGENGLGRYDGQQLVIYQTDPDNPRSISGNFVWALALDQDGVLWVGTGRGLNRYNALTNDFDRFGTGIDSGQTSTSPAGQNPGSHNQSIDNNINALAVDFDNSLIIGTSSGVSILNPQRTHFETWHPDPPEQKDLSHSAVRAVLVDKKNRLWVGTSNNGLNLFNRETKTFSAYRHNPSDPRSLLSNDVGSLEEDYLGRLWVGTYNHGLSRMHTDGQSFSNYTYNPADPHSLGSNNIAYILEDGQKNLWVATDHGGLSLYQPASDNFARFTHSAYDINSLSSNHPRHIYEDNQGNLWIGMFPSDVNFLDQSATVFTNYTYRPDDENSLSNDSILSFHEDSDGTLWIGTENGLNAFDRKKNLITRYPNRHPDAENEHYRAVLSIAEDINGEIWLGTWADGLYRFNKNTGKVIRYLPDAKDPDSINSEFIWRVLRDKDNQIWIATETGGISRYNPATDNFTHYTTSKDNPDSISSNQLWTLIEDRHQDLWIGTQEGLNRFDKKTNRFQRFLANPADNTSISSNQVIALLEDSRGNIWAGTRDAGINIFNKTTATFKRLNVRDGLPSATVTSIIEDNSGNIWVSTVNGLVRIDPDSFAINSYKTSHGLVSNNFSRDATFKDRQGKLYVGSIGGFSVFDPQNMVIEPPPPVVITDFRILNRSLAIGAKNGLLPQSITETKKLTLSHKHTMFSFDFAALSYRSRKSNQYAYMLEGFDQDWIYIGTQRTATYTNINPGEYVFKVKAANRDGVWNETGAAIAIEVTPPAWQTWWAYALYGLIFFSIMYMINKYKNLRIATNIYRALSATDPLTGIYNRAGIAQVADDLFVRRKIQSSVGLLVLDIDFFKPINDIHGHDAGDRVLKEFTNLITHTIRVGDNVARWGGEEFVLLCPHANREGLAALAEKLRKAIADHQFERNYTPLKLTTSIGVACASSEDSFEKVFKRADLALYEAKHNGRNRVVFAD